MNNTLFEQFGGTYTSRAIILPNLTLPAEEETGYIRVWSQRRLNYLNHHRKVLYYNLLTSGKLHSHLVDIEEQAQSFFLRLVKNFPKKKKHYRTTQSYRPNEVGAKENSIRAAATETVCKDVVFV